MTKEQIKEKLYEAFKELERGLSYADAPTAGRALNNYLSEVNELLFVSDKETTNG